LVREDIREEFGQLDISPKGLRVCDFACGSGIFTFSLALEIAEAECIGVDLFSEELSPKKLRQYIGVVRGQCQSPKTTRNLFPVDLCRLVLEEREPQFIKGDIIGNQNLPGNIDLAYCKKILFNLMGEDSKDRLSGEERLLVGLKNITNSIRPSGLICVIEYDKDFRLTRHFEKSELRILRRKQIKRREIRSRGRTNSISTFALYLCQRVEKLGSPTAA
jgi:hypothetical protein